MSTVADSTTSRRAPLRVGLLGCGRIGAMHAELLATAVDGAELAAVYDLDPVLAGAVAERHGVPVAASAAELIGGDCDAVAIITATATHAELIIAAAEAGKPTFCEKPVSLDLATVDAALAAVERAGTLLQVGFNRRFDPSHREVRRQVAGGELGDLHVVRITSRDNPCPPVSYLAGSGGLFLDMTIHDFDLARFLTGSEVVEVYATGRAADPEIDAIGDLDTAVVVLRHESGCTTVIDTSRHAGYGYDQRVEVFGSGGVAGSANPTIDASWRLGPAGVQRAPMFTSFPDRYAGSFVAEWEAFVDAVASGGPSPVSGRDARAPLVIGLAANESVAANRPVAVPAR